MVMLLVYQDAFGASGTFTVNFPATVLRLGNVPGLEEKAEHLQAGSVSLTFDDPDGTLGNAGDAILAQARLSILEFASPIGNQRLYTGVFGGRSYSRRADAPTDSLRTGVSRQIVAELHDLNSLLSFRVIPQSDSTGNRPAETVAARMTWILGTSYTGTVVDEGFVVANTTLMTPSDYRGQRPSNVINDCEMSAGFGWNAFVYWDENAHVPALFFDQANTSTAFTSTLKFSNVRADCDPFDSPTATIFGPSVDATLHRDPTDLGSGVYMPFKNNAVFVERAATVTAYGRKDIIAPNSNVSSLARATAQATDFAFQHSTEEDRITVTVELPASKVNLIRAGQRVQVKFTHLPGYESYTWCRVLSRAPGQTQQNDDRYWVQLVLSPQEAGEPVAPCSTDATPTGSYFPLGGDAGPGTGGLPALSDGVVYYLRPGFSLPSTPTPGFQGDWHFPNWGAGGAGTIDYAGSCVQNQLIFMTVGNGTWNIQTEAGGTVRSLEVSKGPFDDYTVQGYITPGDAVAVTISDASEGDCVRFVVIADTTGTCGNYWGWSVAAWVRA